MNKEEINFSPTGIESFRSRIITIYKYINAEYSKKHLWYYDMCIIFQNIPSAEFLMIMSNINKSIIAFYKSRLIFLHMFQVIYIQTVE